MRENKYLEFKSEITNTFLKTVSAFANFSGGDILFGVDDEGHQIGLDHPEQRLIDIENRINDSISPKPDFSLSVEDNIVRLTVLKGKYTPYLYKGKAYRRSDTASIEVDQGELRELVLESSNISFEELPCGVDVLHFTSLEAKMKEILSIETMSMDILRTIGFVTERKKFNNAAAVFADENSFSGIDIARFGDTISEIMERKTVSGESVLNQYDLAVEFYRRYYQYEKIDGLLRDKVEMVPEKAFREALANALVHRDWSLSSPIRISMYKDKIEINSPGGLPKGINEEEYLSGEISCLRNPIIGNVFFRLHYIEMFGTGVRRIFEAYEDSWIKPKFKVTDHIISVQLPVVGMASHLSAEEISLLEMIKEKQPVSSSTLVQESGHNKAKVIRMLEHLMECGTVAKNGKGRGTRYSLL